jgi:hypothetical protein
MKFILREDKFLLNENPSFFLEERFVLTEDILLEAQATLKQLGIDLNKLNTLLPDLLSVLPTGIALKILDDTPLEGEKLDIEKEIQDNCTEVQNLLERKKNFKTLIDKIRAKAEATEGSFTEDEVKILQPICYSIASDGNSVKDRLKGIKSHKGELAEQVATLQDRLPKLITSINELYKLFSEEPEKKYSLKHTSVKLKVGTTFTLKITPDPKEGDTPTFESADASIATVTPEGLVTAVKKGTTQINVTIADQSLACSVMAMASAVDERGESDWYTLYKACTKCENKEEANRAFWLGGLPKEGDPNPKALPTAATNKMSQGYYAGEWGKHAKLVESFGTPFMTTLKEYGWTEVLNPYIALLRHLFKFEKVWINDASFAAVLKAAKEGLVSENDLRGKGKLEGLELVRNPLFYAKTSKEIADYLNWQKAAKNVEATVYSDAANGLKTVYANIVSAEGNSGDLKDETAYNAISGAGFQYKIRQLVPYKEIIKINLEVDGDKAKAVQATDEDVTKILSKVTDRTAAKKFLAYIVNYYRIAKLSILDALLKEPFGATLTANRNATTTTFEEDKKFDALLQVKAKKYSSEQLKTLVTELLKTAGLLT